jgi:hypothetical protein
MKKIIIVFIIALSLVQSPPVSAASVQSRIASNLGNIYLNGLPKLAFDLGAIPELAEHGFSLRMEHDAMLTHGREVRTRWDIPSLRTCIHPDKEGTLIWIKPGGQMEKFRKTTDGFAKGRNRLQIRAYGEDVIEIRSPRGLIWKYKNGSLDSISGRRFGTLHFTTDRESILKITRQLEGSKPEVLLEVIHSRQGDIEELRLRDNYYCKLQWSPDHMLLGFEDSDEKRTSFIYENGLLAGWRRNDGLSDNLKWTARENAGWLVSQGWPPVALLEDSQYKYRLSRTGSINILRVHTHDNMLVSETRFNSRGIEQRTPAGAIKSTLSGLRDDAPAIEDAEPE